MFLLKVVIYTAIFIELFTVLTRFAFKVSSKEVYVKIMRKFGLKKFYHIHHMFLGIAAALFFYLFQHETLFSIGLGIMASDIIHHFFVLWILLGNPEFHIVYKDIGIFKKEDMIERAKIKRVMGHLIKEVESMDFHPLILENIVSRHTNPLSRKIRLKPVSSHFTKRLPKKHFSKKKK